MLPDEVRDQEWNVIRPLPQGRDFKRKHDEAIGWTTPASTAPVYNAIKLYRNYDGRHSTFGDVSIAATGPNPDEVAVFAAERTSDRALTVMVIAKALSGDRRVSLEIAHANTAAAAEVYRLDASNVITRLPGVDVKDGRLTFTAPPQSLTLLVIPAAAQAATPR